MDDLITVVEDYSGCLPRGVIHVGAAMGEEYPHYLQRGIARQIWIEPQPELFQHLIRNVHWSTFVRCFNVACGNHAGRIKMYRLKGNHGHSNSILPPKEHLKHHPANTLEDVIEVDMVKLDDLLVEFDLHDGLHDMMVIDVQGYEMEVLKGGEKTVDRMSAIVCEVNQEEMYEGCALVADVDRWLEDRGFRRQWTDWCGPQKSYGDAVYIRIPK